MHVAHDDNIPCQQCEGCGFKAANGTCVNRIRLFAGLPDNAKHDLLARSVRSTHRRGDILVHEGTECSSRTTSTTTP